MILLIVRHGVAEDKEVFAETGKSDDERPLTAKGRKKMKRAARGLRALVPRDRPARDEPTVRAQETAATTSPRIRRSTSASVADVLRPDAPFERVHRLAARRSPTVAGLRRRARAAS